MSRRRKAPKKSHLIMVLDRSGSMDRIKSDTEGGFDSMVEKLQEDGNDGFVTLVQFDTEHETVYEQKSLADVPKLTLVPRGSTALLDGVGEAIRRAEKFVKPGDNVSVTIMTDGGENSSREYDKETVTKLMDEKREQGWEFNFLGAGPGAWGGAQMLGIAHTHTINYSGSAKDQETAFAAVAHSHGAKLRGESSSYALAAPELKTHLESKAGAFEALAVDPLTIPVQHRLARKRGSGRPTKS
jgi:hypothetical protein